MGLDWVVGGIGLVGKYMTGKKMPEAWLLSALNQIFWVWLIMEKEMYGFLPITAVNLYMSWRFYYEWKRRP